MMNAPLPIQVEDLYVRYPRKKKAPLEAVRGLSFQVHPGETVGFLGPNGAGKSSTLKVLMGFVSAHFGRAELFGKPAGDAQARSQIGYLPEVAMYYPYLTPLETLSLYGELQGLRGESLRRHAQSLLEQVGLSHAQDRLNRTLSKGMLQRVGIAQSLLGEPKLLILDEMTSGIDPVGRRELREMLKASVNRGCTLFFSSHELSEVEMLCDRILIIDQGKLIDQHRVDHLKEDLEQYTLTLRGAIVAEDLPSGVVQSDMGLVEYTFHYKDELLRAVRSATTQNVEIIDIATRSLSFEDYFVETLEQQREAA